MKLINVTPGCVADTYETIKNIGIRAGDIVNIKGSVKYDGIYVVSLMDVTRAWSRSCSRCPFGRDIYNGRVHVCGLFRRTKTSRVPICVSDARIPALKNLEFKLINDIMEDL